MEGSEIEISLINNLQVTLHRCLEILNGNGALIDYVITQIESCISGIILVEETARSLSWASRIVEKLEETRDLLISMDEQLILPTGRNPILIPKAKLEYFLSLNFKVPDICKMLGVSRATIFRRFRDYDLSISQTYSVITDEELQNVVTQQLLSHPNTGYKRMKGYLSLCSIRIPDQRVREIMRVVDPEGVYQRTRANRAIVRREYFVPYFNSMWHIDGNHKLNRWGIVVRCGIDGKSRTATYIAATGDNRADTHLEAFVHGVQKYGIPIRTRTDKGGENVLIAKFMIERRGTGRGSHIVGKSTHNQRIERFWKDVFYGSLAFFYTVFKKMEEDGVLNIDDPRHICILHKIFLPRININLQTFVEGWNLHPLSSDRNYTPTQLMVMNLPPVEYDLDEPLNLNHDDNFIHNIQDLNQLMHPPEESLINPIINYDCLNDEQIEFLDRIDSIRPSGSYGYDIFLEAIQCLN